MMLTVFLLVLSPVLALTYDVEMSSPKSLFQKWANQAPPQAKFSDVKLVVEEFFPPEEIHAGPGSHLIIIEGMTTELATTFKARGLSELAWLDGDSLSISTVKGRWVKRVWIQQLVKLIQVRLKAEKDNLL